MRNKVRILSILFFSIFLSNCDGNKKTIKKKNVSQEKDYSICKKYLKKYKENFIIEENDSALVYINKAIECNPNNNSYKNSKVTFLITIENYNEAIKQLDELIDITNDPALRLQKSVVKLKINDKTSNELLKENYKEFDEIKKPTSSNLFYKIALDNYFKGKEYALKEIEKTRFVYKDKLYEVDNFKVLDELINTEKREVVLFKLFNIDK